MSNLLDLDESSIIDYDFFMSFKDHITIDNHLKDQINKIFDHNYKSNYNQNVITYYSNYVVPKNKFKNKEKNIVRKVKDKKLELFSLLNKLTELNFKNTLNEILNIISKDYNIFIDSIDNFWAFCYKQSIYSVMYIEILKAILIKQKDKTLEKIIIDKLKNIIEQFLNNELYEKKDNKDDYDGFCDSNKIEKYIKGKIITICWIIKNTSFNIVTKVAFIDNIQKHNFDNEIILDVLQIYNTIIGLENNILEYLQDYKVTNTNLNNINKFKIMNIIENKPFQMDGYIIIKYVNVIKQYSNTNDDLVNSIPKKIIVSLVNKQPNIRFINKNNEIPYKINSRNSIWKK